MLSQDLLIEIISPSSMIDPMGGGVESQELVHQINFHPYLPPPNAPISPEIQPLPPHRDPPVSSPTVKPHHAPPPCPFEAIRGFMSPESTVSASSTIKPAQIRSSAAEIPRHAPPPPASDARSASDAIKKMTISFFQKKFVPTYLNPMTTFQHASKPITQPQKTRSHSNTPTSSLLPFARPRPSNTPPTPYPPFCARPHKNHNTRPIHLFHSPTSTKSALPLIINPQRVNYRSQTCRSYTLHRTHSPRQPLRTTPRHSRAPTKSRK